MQALETDLLFWISDLHHAGWTNVLMSSSHLSWAFTSIKWGVDTVHSVAETIKWGAARSVCAWMCVHSCMRVSLRVSVCLRACVLCKGTSVCVCAPSAWACLRVYAFVYVCASLCVNVCKHVCVCVYACLHVFVAHVCVWMCVCACLFVHKDVYECVSLCTAARPCACLFTYVLVSPLSRQEAQ